MLCEINAADLQGFKNRDWLPKNAILFSKSGNSQGAYPGFETCQILV